MCLIFLAHLDAAWHILVPHIAQRLAPRVVVLEEQRYIVGPGWLELGARGPGGLQVQAQVHERALGN